MEATYLDTTHLDCEALVQILYCGFANLKKHAPEIDDLNVFPIPDGDTGKNMCMTVEGGINAIKAGGYENRVDLLMQKFARGSLLGARGNSGVILSQFIRGFSIGCEGKKVLSAENAVEAFGCGVKKAYAAVVNPTEGTMLTVMREGYEFLATLGNGISYQELINRLIGAMKKSLENTPELLPILKESGVIDSGGAGFLCLFEGMENFISDSSGNRSGGSDGTYGSDSSHFREEFSASGSSLARNGFQASDNAMPVDLNAFNADSELEFGYCTEFILQLQHKKVDISKFNIQTIITYLEEIGNSIVAVQDDDLVKIHVHTFTPGKALNFCQQFGEFITLKIENMSVQHNEIMVMENLKDRPKQKIRKDIAIVAVANGDGLKSYLQEIGVDVVVDGGQTDNPSTEDMIEAYERIEANHIIVLPCNSNIIMVAEQSAEIYKKAAIHVLKAKSFVQGYSALSMFNPELRIDELLSDMEDAMEHVVSGQIAKSTRNADFEGLNVRKDEYIGLLRVDSQPEQLVCSAPTKIEAVKALMNKVEDIKDREVLSVFYGASVTDEELAVLERMLSSDFSHMEYGIVKGGQEVYDFILAIE